jgi:succinate-semialdehyde dehydrogenase / glutarate-semialdehyde dehydrogenase
MGFQTQNPATGEFLKRFEHLTSAQVEHQIESANKIFHERRMQSVSDRAAKLEALAQGLRSDLEPLARQMTLEMGKAIKDSKTEIEKCAVTFEYFAKNLSKFLSDETVEMENLKGKIVKDPLGPILAVMPWNFPIWQVVRFAAPAVGIGNPVLLKHSDLTAGTSEMLATIFDRVEKGLLFNLRVDHDQAARVIGDKRVRGVTLTGSTRAGREVAAQAGRHLKKTVLELGGSDAYVVFADSDVEQAAKICAKARMTNNGQSCVAAKRFIVEDKIRDEFMGHFIDTLKTMSFGDPMNPQFAVGSLASKKFQSQLLEQCKSIETASTRKVFDFADSSGFRFDGPDAFFPARVYLVPTDLDAAFEEELFGPVALVFSFSTETEALALCNRSLYGLGGAVFSRDQALAERFARQMECGFVAINDQVRSDARLPFGGVKESGFGRELSLYGFNEFCNIKSLTTRP